MLQEMLGCGGSPRLSKKERRQLLIGWDQTSASLEGA